MLVEPVPGQVDIRGDAEVGETGVLLDTGERAARRAGAGQETRVGREAGEGLARRHGLVGRA